MSNQALDQYIDYAIDNEISEEELEEMISRAEYYFDECKGFNDYTSDTHGLAE